MLTDGCQADSIPNLEIETGEIEGAGHASATGRFDDEQLFYLRSRGIEEDEARRLVVHGFFNDLIRKIGVPEHRGAAARHRRGRAGQERAEPRPAGAADGLRASLRAGRRRRRPGPRRRRRRLRGRRRPRTATRSSRSRTSAATRPSRCPRARSRTAPSSAGCTARASTCAPASRPACPATEPVATFPVDVRDGVRLRRHADRHHH